jgi:hypothetical protein
MCSARFVRDTLGPAPNRISVDMHTRSPSLPIVIIGPMAAGKSTLARALSRRLGIRQVPLDAVRWYYHLVDGFDIAAQPEPGNFREVVRRWAPYSISAVERVLAEFPDAIIDFGAGHAHYDDPDHVRRLERALAPVRHVVWLRPFADHQRSAEVCARRDAERLGPQHDPSRAEVNEDFLRSACFARVATHTITVEGRSIDEVADALVPALMADGRD